MDATNDSFFNEEDERVLAKTRKIRENVVDKMVEGGVPETVGEIRVLNETLSSLDKQITDTASIRTKHSATESNERTAAMVIATLQNVQRRTKKHRTGDIAIPVEFIPDDIVPGEIDVTPKELVLADFIDGEVE